MCILSTLSVFAVEGEGWFFHFDWVIVSLQVNKWSDLSSLSSFDAQHCVFSQAVTQSQGFHKAEGGNLNEDFSLEQGISHLRFKMHYIAGVDPTLANAEESAPP